PSVLSSSFPLRPPPTPTLFPYTTLFRSHVGSRTADTQALRIGQYRCQPGRFGTRQSGGFLAEKRLRSGLGAINTRTEFRQVQVRSEEHTSELQSRENLVCRLLLENKKRH